VGVSRNLRWLLFTPYKFADGRRGWVREVKQGFVKMQSFLNPLGMDIASSASAIDELFDEVLPLGGEPQQAVPAGLSAAGLAQGLAQGSLVHKDMWDDLLTDDLVAPGGAERSKRDRAAASISSQFSDDGLPLQASLLRDDETRGS
jgi:hypothetical protein